jgi:hypothetical protein
MQTFTQARLFRMMTKHTLSGRRSADIAHAMHTKSIEVVGVSLIVRLQTKWNSRGISLMESSYLMGMLRGVSLLVQTTQQNVCQ